MQTAAEVMSTSVYTLSECDSVKDAIELLVLENISGAPVVNEDLKVLGVISEFDLLLAIHTVGGNMPITKVMNEKPITVTEKTDLEEVMDSIILNGIKRVIVVDSEERLKGILSRHDILSYFHTHEW